MLIRVLILMLFILSLPLSISAAPSSLQVSPVYPDNQVPETKGYFDVTTTPGKRVELQLKLQNTADFPITVRVEKANAYTNPIGGIFYYASMESENTMLLNDAILLADALQTEETLTIPANESFDLPIQLTVPQTDAQTLLGGIKVTQVDEESDESQDLEKDEANFVLKTETTYAVAIQLNLPASAEPNFSTGGAGFIAPTAQVYLELLNDAHLIQGDIEWTYSVSDDTGVELFEGTVDTFNMAPKSKIRFPLAWNHAELADGSYTLTADGHAGDKVITVKENFEISTEEVEEYAAVINPSPTDDEDGMSMWIWIVAAGIFGLIMFFAGRRKRSGDGVLKEST